MGGGYEKKPGSSIYDTFGGAAASSPIGPGRQTLSEHLPANVADVGAPVQRSANTVAGSGSDQGGAVQKAAAQGISGAGEPLPHRPTIQQLFGRHDVSGIQAHVGGPAETASRAIGAEAYATGNHVAFAGAPSLHTAAHEAAHVVQQRGGVQLKGGVGEAGDAHEQHANAVADAVVQGKSAEPLLDHYASGGSSGASGSTAVQRFESREHAELGDQVHPAVGATAAVSNAETGRLAKDNFTDGQRSLSLELRVRNPQTGLPTENTQSVPVSYGEMIALSGDFYYSVDNLRKAPAQEVTTIRNLIADERRDPKGRDFDSAYEAATAWRREGVYQPGTGEKEGTKGQYFGVQPGDAAHNETSTYIDLATENNAHFSAETGAIAVPDGPEGNAASNNHQGWLTDHSRAITLAKRVRELKQKAGLLSGSAAPTTPAPAPAPAMSASGAKVEGGDSNDIATLENLAYVYNSGGDHYLTDAFSAGHLINKALLAPITDKVLNESMFGVMVDSLMPYAMKEPAVLGISPNAIGAGGGGAVGAIAGFFIGGPIGAIIGGVGGAIGGHAGMKAYVRSKLKEGLSVFKTDPKLLHNVGAKLVHDYLNAHGATVTSRNGRFHYTTMGDATMDASTKDIAARAVLASRNYIRALMNDSDADLGQPQNADDAWEYTPNVDVTELTARAEPMLRAQLADTPHLWELMKTAVKVKESRAKQDETEKSTAATAKKDRGGDWGQQPNPRFTRRMIVAQDS